MVQVRVQIQIQHVQHGITMDCTRCPGALAINEHLVPRAYANVGRKDYTILDPSRMYGRHPNDPYTLYTYKPPRKSTPTKLQEFIRQFDTLADHTRVDYRKTWKYDKLVRDVAAGLYVFEIDVPADMLLNGD